MSTKHSKVNTDARNAQPTRKQFKTKPITSANQKKSQKAGKTENNIPPIRITNDL